METTSLFKSKAFKALVVVIVISAITMRVAMHLMGAEKHRALIVTEISKIVAGKTVTINKPLVLEAIPVLNKAKIIIQDLDIKDSETFLNSKAIVITVSLIDFLFGKLNYKSIEIDGLNLFLTSNIDDKQNIIKNWAFIYDNTNKKSDLLHIKNIKLSNSKLVYNNQNFNFNIENANFNIDSNETDKIYLSGTFNISDSYYQIDAKKEINSDSLEINLKNDGTNLLLRGNLITSAEKFLISGKTEIKLTKPSFVSKSVIKAIPFMQGMQKNTLNDHLEIKGDLSFQDNQFQMNNLIINSLKTKGSGEVKINLISPKSFALNLNFAQLDLTDWFDFGPDKLVKALSNAQNFTSANQQKEEQTSYINFNLIDDENTNINLEVKKIILENSDINNFKFNFNTSTGFVNSGNLSFDIYNNGNSTSISLTNLNFQKIDNTHLLLGEFHNEGDNINNTIKILNLQDFIDLDGSQLNYSIDSKIIFSAKEISLFKITGKIGNSGLINGSIASTHDKMSHFNFDLKLNNLSLDNFKLPIIQERGYSLITKSNNDDYLSYFRWFRTLTSSYRFKIILQNTQIKDENINSMLITSDLSPGIMNTEINMDSNFTKGIYKFELTATQLKPTISLITNLDFVKLDKLIDLTNYFFNTSNTTQEKTTSAEESLNFWSDKKLNIFNIQKYGAKIDLSAKEILVKNKNLNNFRLLAHTSSDVLYFDNIYFKAYGGEFQTKGNISFFDDLLYQISFNTSGMESKDIINDFFPYLEGIEGKFAATGSIIAQGNSLKNLFSSMQVSSNILAPSMKINGFSSDDIIDIALKRVDINPDVVLVKINDLLNNGTNEITNLTGSIQGNNGKLNSNNLTFRTRFSQGVFGMSLDLNNFTFSSTAQISFAPYIGNQIISYNINKTGSLLGKLDTTIDNKNLLTYIKKQYGIITEEDVIVQQKILQEQKRKMAEDPENKDYLYYKLQQQLNDTQNK